MIRPLQVTDMPAYWSFRSQATVNQALPGPHQRPGGPSITRFLRHSFSLKPGRETWGQFVKGQIAGFVAVTRRYGTDIWDVDQLHALASTESEPIYCTLLGQLCTAASPAGVSRVFLRAGQESPVLAAAKRAGFSQYTVEQIYHLPSYETASLTAIPSFRPRQRADHQALFQLYCAAVPFSVREIEGMTLQEWRWTEGWELWPASWAAALWHDRRDFVLDLGREITAWLQIYSRSGSLILLTRPMEPGELAGILCYGLKCLRPGRAVTCPARTYQTSLGPCLEQLGLRLVNEHALLTRALAIRVPEPKLMPVQISAG